MLCESVLGISKLVYKEVFSHDELLAELLVSGNIRFNLRYFRVVVFKQILLINLLL